jgi:hypothetical protein
MLRGNERIDLFLEKLGGNDYCKSIPHNPLRSFHLAIYSAVKAQLAVNKHTQFKYAFKLVEQVDKIIHEKIPMKNIIRIRSPEEIYFTR